MKETYFVCRKCGRLMPLTNYFFSQEEYQKLHPEHRKYCIVCLEKMKGVKAIPNQTKLL